MGDKTPYPGIPIEEFCALMKVATLRYGEGLTISGADKAGHMHLFKDQEHFKEHLGYIDLNSGSLVWDGAK